MKGIAVCLYLFSVCLFAWPAAAASYYVDSANGLDSQKGDSPQQAWQSLEKLNSIVFQPSDTIFLKAGSRFAGQLKPQGCGKLVHGQDNPITIDKYGDGNKPCIEAQGKYQAAIYLYNVEYWRIQNLEVTNKGDQRQANRYGIYIHINNFGTANNIQLRNLDIHDVNGSLVKKEGGGAAIFYQNGGKETKSRFNGLLIEDCHIARCERNAFTGTGNWKRDNWYPNLNVVIRKNVIEQVPGDGIVPIACDGARVEYNIMRDCTALLPAGEAAAGIWPWSCDNTIIQYNEVSDHKAPWDGQGFDSDWNCTNTVIQYNYSHDNEGGFLLVCNAGEMKMPESIGNKGTVVRYNLSVNDGIRQKPTHVGVFSPTFHISGPCEDTRIYNNTIVIRKKPTQTVDRTFLKMDNWGGPWPVNTRFSNNIVYTEDEIKYEYGKAQNTTFERNLYYGNQLNAPEDTSGLREDPLFVGVDPQKNNTQGMFAYRLKENSPCVAAGAIVENPGLFDLSGNRLPKDKKPTIGAFEYNSVSQTADPKETIQAETADKEGTVHTTGNIEPNPLAVIVIEVTETPLANDNE